MVFDLDPDEGLDFATCKAAAQGHASSGLQTLGLESFPMVTGGKGIHVVVPLKRGHSWDEHRDFAEAMARADGGGRARSLRRQHVEGEAARKNLHRLSAQPARRDRDLRRISTRARPGAHVALPVIVGGAGASSRTRIRSTVEGRRARSCARAAIPGRAISRCKQALPKLEGLKSACADRLETCVEQIAN